MKQIKTVTLAAALLLSTSAHAGFDAELLLNHCQDREAFWTYPPDLNAKSAGRLQRHSFARGYLSAVGDKLDICLPEEPGSLGNYYCGAYVNYVMENGIGGNSAYDIAEKSLVEGFPCKEGK